LKQVRQRDDMAITSPLPTKLSRLRTSAKKLEGPLSPLARVSLSFVRQTSQ
jgi:hypothetical protein